MGKTPQSGAITNIASQQAATAQPLIAAGTALTNQTANGQLPSAVQSELDQQLQQQINQIQAQYAQMGLSGSTMEQQAIQNAQNQYQSQVASQLQSFMQQGVNDISQGNSDLSGAGGTYQNLANTQLQQQQGMSTAIANLLKAFSGGGGNSTSIGG
jgi:DNA repair exonuclease SbcCD ATPase subunit